LTWMSGKIQENPYLYLFDLTIFFLEFVKPWQKISSSGLQSRP
jgi:hypothetical protein